MENFSATIIGDPTRVVTFTKATVALHNYLRTMESSVYCPPGFTDGAGNVIEGSWRSEDDLSGLQQLGQAGGNW